MNSLSEYQIGSKIVVLFMLVSVFFAFGIYKKVYALTGDIYELQQQGAVYE